MSICRSLVCDWNCQECRVANGSNDLVRLAKKGQISALGHVNHNKTGSLVHPDYRFAPFLLLLSAGKLKVVSHPAKPPLIKEANRVCAIPKPRISDLK